MCVSYRSVTSSLCKCVSVYMSVRRLCCYREELYISTISSVPHLITANFKTNSNVPLGGQ